MNKNEVLERVKLEKPNTYMNGKKRLNPIEVRERVVAIKDEELKKMVIQL